VEGGSNKGGLTPSTEKLVLNEKDMVINFTMSISRPLSTNSSHFKKIVITNFTKAAGFLVMADRKSVV
jgi:hypothetical protein